MEHVKIIQPQIRNFKVEDLMKYCMNMADTSLQNPTAQFIKQVLNDYTEEDKECNTEEMCLLM